MLVTGAPHTPLAGRATAASANASTRTATVNATTNTATAAAPLPLNRSASAVRLRPLSPLHANARQQQQQQQQRPLSPPLAAAPSSPPHSLSQRSLAHGGDSAAAASASASGSVCDSCGAAVATAATSTDHSSPPSMLDSIAAPSSLDSYLSLSEQQSAQGLELVYSLKIELSKMVEELSDRFPDGGVARLPYRVVGHGGMLWWQEVREGKRRPPEAEAEHASASAADPGLPPSDPFATLLPSVQAPPPPLTPSTVLPGMVLLNMLRVGVRTVLARGEDRVDELGNRLAESEAARARLAAQLEQALARTPTPTAAAASAAATAAAAGASPPGSPGQRSRSRKTVQFSEEHQGPVGSAPPPAPAAAAAAVGSGGESYPASPPFSPSLSSSNGNNAAAADSLSLSLSSLASSGNWTREDALARALVLAEQSISRWKARARAGADAAEKERASHRDELTSLKAALGAREKALEEQARALTQRSVLLQLESISRRERAQKAEQMHAYYAGQIRAWELEVKELLNPRRERLFVRKADQALPAAVPGSTGFVTALGTGGGRTPAVPSAGVGRGAKRRGGTTPALLSPPPEAADESKEGPEQRLVITAATEAGAGGGALTPSKPLRAGPGDTDPASSLYPSPSSPLVLLQQSMKTPAGRQWLGKMLSPPGSSAAGTGSGSSAGSGVLVERDGLFVVAEKKTSASAGEGNGGSSSSGTTQGHLVPGADLLAVDLLLVLDELFRREYASLSRESVELAKSLRFGAQLDERRRGIREGTASTTATGTAGGPGNGANDGAGSGAGAESGEVGPDGCPTPAALAALISSIPAASLAYLQALQRLFLSLYARLPASVQARFAKLQSQSQAAGKKVDILNQRFRDTMLQAQAGAEKKDVLASGTGAASATAAAADAKSTPAKPQQTEPSVWAQHQLQAVMDDLRGIDVHARLGAGPASSSAPMQVPSLPPPGSALHTPTKGDAAAGQLLIPARPPSLQVDSFAPLSSTQPRQSHLHSSSATLSAAMTLALPGASSHSHSGAATPAASGEVAGSGCASGSDRDSSAYLARLELILHKVRALANFRDVVLNI